LLRFCLLSRVFQATAVGSHVGVLKAYPERSQRVKRLVNS
jgi:hypothetical protein